MSSCLSYQYHLKVWLYRHSYCHSYFHELTLLQSGKSVGQRKQKAKKEISNAVVGIKKAFREVDMYALPHPGQTVIEASVGSSIYVSGKIVTPCILKLDTCTYNLKIKHSFWFLSHNLVPQYHEWVRQVRKESKLFSSLLDHTSQQIHFFNVYVKRVRWDWQIKNQTVGCPGPIFLVTSLLWCFTPYIWFTYELTNVIPLILTSFLT